MSFFHNTVEQRYINKLDSTLIYSKFDEFKAYFGNPEIQENIHSSKEEQFLGGFFKRVIC